MMKQEVFVEMVSENPPYRGRTQTYDVVSNFQIGPSYPWQSEDGSLLRQTALRHTACIPSNGTMLKFKDDPEREWHETYIESYEEIKPGHARVVIKTPNLD